MAPRRAPALAGPPSESTPPRGGRSPRPCPARLRRPCGPLSAGSRSFRVGEDGCARTLDFGDGWLYRHFPPQFIACEARRQTRIHSRRGRLRPHVGWPAGSRPGRGGLRWAHSRRTARRSITERVARGGGGPCSEGDRYIFIGKKKKEINSSEWRRCNLIQPPRHMDIYTTIRSPLFVYPSSLFFCCYYRIFLLPSS